MTTTGNLYIISAPSGAGKTSLVKKLIATVENLIVSVSHTTRQSREGEIHGKDYFFVSVDDFRAMQNDNAFLESAQVFDNFYGTAKKTVETNLAQGDDVILEIDWQGAKQVRDLMPNSYSIFILPPSTHILRERLEGRGKDSVEIIDRRMQDAVAEMSHYGEFDYLVVNDDFNTALNELESIIMANRLQQKSQAIKLKSLIHDLLA
ncbi:MAG: guanylate kinase [Methylococcales bacterium]|nr:guanylate kinase [Methylococcales bacterium]